MELYPVIQYFQKLFPALRQEDIEEVLQISKLKTFHKGDILASAGDNRKIIAFVIKGIVRAYYVKENGQEMTPFFWPEQAFVGPWESIYLDQPSQLTFELIEDAELAIIDFVALKKLVDRNDAIRRVYLTMVETILTNTLMHTQSVKNEKPEDRYLHFLKENADIAPRISQKHLASFLGITPISLSRMKKRLER